VQDVHDPTKVLAEAIASAQLEVFDYEASLVPEPTSTSLYDTVARAGRLPAVSGTPGVETLYIFDRATHQLVAGPFGRDPSTSRARAFAALRRALGTGARSWDDVVLGVVPRGWMVVSSPQPSGTGQTPGVTTYLILRNTPALIPQDVRSAQAEGPPPGAGPVPGVLTVQLTPDGQRASRDLTRRLAARGRSTGRDQSAALVLNGQLITNPVIDPSVYPNGIDASSGLQIPGDQLASDLSTLASRLTDGALAGRVDIVSQHVVVVRLGHDALRNGLIIALVGLGITLMLVLICVPALWGARI
jgi:hypothetical protein